MLHMALGTFEYRSSESLSHLNANLNPICPLLALLGAHHILLVSRIRVNVLMSTYILYIYFPFRKIRWTISGVPTGLCFVKVGEGTTYS